MTKEIYLSVVVPAYNEEENIKRGVLEGVYSYLKRQEFNWELIIADDGSKDNTLSELRKYKKDRDGIKILAEPHRGKGGTVIAGILASRGKYVLFTDLDQATPIYELEKLIPFFDLGYDVVIGSRSGRKGAPFIRKMMALGFSVLRTLILRLPFKDTQCGFKAFKRDAAQKIFSKMKVFKGSMDKNAGVTAGFDLELLYIARKMKFRIKEVSVEWHHMETERVSSIKDSWQGLRDMLKVRLNAIKGLYK